MKIQTFIFVSVIAGAGASAALSSLSPGNLDDEHQETAGWLLEEEGGFEL